ncbi:MAG TPA: alpha/beta hydrolase-fold protein [Thermoanaerobaculia bacterium]|jgi:predicted alpha/beta superfamily hydrolase|nr:alpha/beta hydrolase-fold protein [Thermoanaerobaculia bacterium]
MKIRSLSRTLCLLALGAAALAPGARAQPFTVTFVLDMHPAVARGRFDPKTDQVGVRGGAVPLSWEESLLAADPDGDGRYEVTVTFPRTPFGGQGIAYKFKIEHPVRRADEGWEEFRNRLLFLRTATQTVSRGFDAPPEPIELSRVGTIRRHPAFPSHFVAPREVQVYLPPSYDQAPRRRYPVLYLHDGQSVFDGADQGMEWQVDETAEALISKGRIEPVIIVAVHNTEARMDEYGPTPVDWKDDDGTVRRIGGKADRYGRFLIEELKPFIDRTYRTKSGPGDTAIGGASLGGLVSLWLALDHPKTFGAALAVSPAAPWDNELLARKISALPKKPRLRVYADVGSKEGDDFVAAILRLRDTLQKKGWKMGADLAFIEQEGGQHEELSWASRVEGMLLFLYGSGKR